MEIGKVKNVEPTWNAILIKVLICVLLVVGVVVALVMTNQTIINYRTIMAIEPHSVATSITNPNDSLDNKLYEVRYVSSVTDDHVRVDGTIMTKERLLSKLTKKYELVDLPDVVVNVVPYDEFYNQHLKQLAAAKYIYTETFTPNPYDEDVKPTMLIIMDSISVVDSIHYVKYRMFKYGWEYQLYLTNKKKFPQFPVYRYSMSMLGTSVYTKTKYNDKKLVDCDLIERDPLNNEEDRLNAFTEHKTSTLIELFAEYCKNTECKATNTWEFK